MTVERRTGPSTSEMFRIPVSEFPGTTSPGASQVTFE